MKVHQEIGAEICCPYCKNPLIKGFVQSSRQIYFNRGERPRIFASGDLSSINISDLGAIKAPSVEAAYCPKCKKIIMDL